MAIQPDQPQSIGGVLDIAFQLYKASIGKVWPICLLLIVASSPPTIYLIMKGGMDPADPLAAVAMLSDPTYWLMYLLSLVLTMWVLGGLYLKVHSIGTGAEQTAGAALQAALGRALPLVLLTILFAIAVGVGTVLLVVPGIILMISLMLAWNLALFEGKGPIASLTGSHHLVWGNWWRTAAILTVGFIILLVIYFAVGVIVGVIAPLVGMNAQDPFLFGLVSGFAIGAVINLLVTPFYVALLMSIYWDLKLRKEGGDLAARVNALGAA